MVDRISLKARFAVACTLLFLVAMWLPVQYAIHTLRDNTKLMLAGELAADADQLAAIAGEHLRTRKSVLQAVAANLNPVSLDRPEELRHYLLKNRDFLAVFGLGMALTSRRGIVLADYPAIPGRQGADFSTYDSFQRALSSGRIALGNPMRSRFSGNPLYDIAAPVRDARGEIKGMLMGAISLTDEALLGRPGDIKRKGFSYFIVSPSQRIIVSASDPSWILKPVFAELDEILVKSSLFPLGQDATVTIGGVPHSISLRPIPDSGWHLLGLRRIDVAFWPLADMQRQLLWFAGALSVLTLLMIWRLGGVLLKPLSHLAKILEEKSGVDVPHEAIEGFGPVEVRGIAESYNRLAETIAAQTKRINEEKERFRILADSSPVLLFLSDSDGNVKWSNATWRLFAGTGEVHQFADLLHADDREEVLRQTGAYRKARLPYDGEFRILRHDGDYRWMHCRSMPAFSPDRTYIGVVTSCIDVTARKLESEEQRCLLEENRKLVASIFQVIEQERQKIARDLHDDVGQWITAIRANAASISRSIPQLPDAASLAVEAIGNCAISLHTAVRRMLQELRPSHMDTLELADGLQEFARQWQRAFPEFECTLLMDDNLPIVSTDVRVVFYRVLQESLTNVVRHSEATQVCICLRQQQGLFPGDGRIELLIEDNGVGFSQEGRDTGGLGLVGMRERVMAVRGDFKITSLPGRGTKILVSAVPNSGKGRNE